MKTEKNPRNAGRKKLPDDKKMVKYGGGLMPPDMIEWISQNGGIAIVREAIEFYRYHHEK